MVATVTDEQSAARELVRGWARTAASGAAATAAVRDMEYGFEEGNADAWRPVFAGLAGLGLFGVAVPEDCGGAGGSIEDLCAMVDEAARALVPGPVATTAVATLVVSDPKLRSALASGERFAGVAIDGGVQVDPKTSTASGTVGRVLGGAPGGVVLLPADGNWLLVDTACDEVVVEPLRATDFSLPLARMVLTSAPVTVLEVSGERVEDLAATVLAAEAAGVARWTLDTAVAYAKVREQFGKPIGSFQAVKHLCAQMLCRAEQADVAAADAARAAADSDGTQLSIAAAVAASIGIDAAKANAKDCIQVRLSMSARELPASVPVWLVWHIPGGTVWAEEAAFRGALATIGARAFGRSGGRILQAGAFGLSHIADARATGEPLVLTVLATGIAGWMFGWLADRSGSLAAPLLTHLAINEAGAVAAVLVQRRSGISTRL